MFCQLSWLTRHDVLSASEQAQRLRDAQETAGASTAAAARALKMAQEAREVACATLNELGAQADALKCAAASLGEAEAAVDASERTLDDINAGCFGCLAPRRRLARRQLVPVSGGGSGTWRRWWSPGAGASAAAERCEAPAPAEASSAASQRLRKPVSAKSAAARARLASSQPSRAVAGGAAGGYAQAGGSKGSGCGGAYGDALLDKEASAQDAALSQLDATVRRAAALQRQALDLQRAHGVELRLADVACGAQVSELAVISSRIGEELDQQVRARALRGTHHCRSVGQSV